MGVNAGISVNDEEKHFIFIIMKCLCVLLRSFTSLEQMNAAKRYVRFVAFIYSLVCCCVHLLPFSLLAFNLDVAFPNYTINICFGFSSVHLRFQNSVHFSLGLLSTSFPLFFFYFLIFFS